MACKERKFRIVGRGGRHGDWRAARARYLEVGQVAHAGPHLLVGSAEIAEDAEQLVDFAVAREKRAAVDHFCEYAADGPDVDGRGVVLGSEQNLGGAVPQSNDLCKSKRMQWIAKMQMCRWE